MHKIIKSQDTCFKKENFHAFKNNYPYISVVGKSNVGKSTLINKIIGFNKLITHNSFNVTRDATIHLINNKEIKFNLIDTGGWNKKKDNINLQIKKQIKDIIYISDLILFVVNSSTYLTKEDDSIMYFLKKSKKRIILIINDIKKEFKKLNNNYKKRINSLQYTGFQQMHSCNVLDNSSIGNILKVIFYNLKNDLKICDIPKSNFNILDKHASKIIKIALIGKENVGKSLILNKLSNLNRVIVSSLPGTTRDSVKQIIKFEKQSIQLQDTAGLRNNSKFSKGINFYSYIRSIQAIKESEIVILVIDSNDLFISNQNLKIINKIIKYGKAIVIVFNKWDILSNENKIKIREILRNEWRYYNWIPKVEFSAKTGFNKQKLINTIGQIYKSWSTRINTSVMNDYISRIINSDKKNIFINQKLLFITQTSSRPPSFVLFSKKKINNNLIKHIIKLLRKNFKLYGTPVNLYIKTKKDK